LRFHGRHRGLTNRGWLCALALLLCARAAAAQHVDAREVVLDNGMRVLLVPRPGDPLLAAGWVARAGSVNEHSGITGITHLLEHMMFKGTRTIGTTNATADAKVLRELDRVRAELAGEEQRLEQRRRVGEIRDANDPGQRSARHRELLAKFAELSQAEKALEIKDEFDRIYTNAGAADSNATTTPDFTLYYVKVPVKRLELWFWMESDRLLHPVFREFYTERAVVREERRLRIDSTPTGKFDELFDAMFWQSSPYGWPVAGWPSDLENITRQEALDYFSVNYAPGNVTACLVGDFDPAAAEALARKYFGRIPRGPRPPAPVRTAEMKQLAEKRMVAYVDASPQVVIRYHTVADGHRDESALLLLADILNGNTGRLYQSLVLRDGVANSADASQEGRKYEGLFEFQGVARPGTKPEEVEQAIYQEIARLQKEKVGEKELRKVKNRNAADDFRRLQSNFNLMMQLLVCEAYRGWRTLDTDSAQMQAVTADDIMRVANTYFAPENRTVGIYHTKGAADAGKIASDQ
jgi:predicted Zn-dependent peptidase